MKKKQSNQIRRSVKIKKESEIALLFKNGNKWGCPIGSIFYLKNRLRHSRLGIIVSKENGTSVKRNRIKRMIREIFRKTIKDPPPHLDIIIKASIKNVTVRKKQFEGAIKKWYDGIKK